MVIAWICSNMPGFATTGGFPKQLLEAAADPMLVM